VCLNRLVLRRFQRPGRDVRRCATHHAGQANSPIWYPGMGLKLGPQRSAYVLHNQHEVKWVGGAGLELGYEMTVEVAGFGGFGVHEETSTADVVREFNQAGKDVLEHSGPKSCTFVVGVYTESSEQGYWLGIAAASTHPAGDRLRV
jgi:hypothetical protein